MAIDVGIDGDLSTTYGGGYTVVNIENPANATGLITQMSIYANGLCENVEVAIFSAVGDSLTTRSYVSVPNLGVGAHGITGLHLEVRTGDYVGMYWTAATGKGVDAEATGGQGVWRASSDQIPCSGRTFDVIAGQTLSISAAGYQLGHINIGDVHKDAQNVLINIGDAWKQITYGSVTNIGDVWKNILF